MSWEWNFCISSNEKLTILFSSVVSFRYYFQIVESVVQCCALLLLIPQSKLLQKYISRILLCTNHNLICILFHRDSTQSSCFKNMCSIYCCTQNTIIMTCLRRYHLWLSLDRDLDCDTDSFCHVACGMGSFLLVCCACRTILGQNVVANLVSMMSLEVVGRKWSNEWRLSFTTRCCHDNLYSIHCWEIF